MKDELQVQEEENIVTTPEDVKKLRTSDWYIHLVEEIRSRIVETEFSQRLAVLEMWWNVGKEVALNTDNFNRAKMYGSQVAETVGADIHRGGRSVRYAMKFYKDNPSFESFVARIGKDYSWNKYTKGLEPGEPLPKKSEAEPMLAEDGTPIPPKPFAEFTWDKQKKKWQLRMNPEEFKTIDFSVVKEDLLTFLEHPPIE